MNSGEWISSAGAINLAMLIQRAGGFASGALLSWFRHRKYRARLVQTDAEPSLVGSADGTPNLQLQGFQDGDLRSEPVRLKPSRRETAIVISSSERLPFSCSGNRSRGSDFERR